jgi:predicted negative regulator of RcsB-dependent stress response
LQWVVDKSKEDDLKHIARVRLAGVLIDEKTEASYAEALKLMEADRPAFYDPLYGDRKGDILMAQGKMAEARAAWEAAYLKADARNPIRQILQLKLELAGGSAPVSPKS